jgi:hypothetical protein
LYYLRNDNQKYPFFVWAVVAFLVYITVVERFKKQVTLKLRNESVLGSETRRKTRNEDLHRIQKLSVSCT